MPRIVTVFGATGLQGSSVLERLLKDSTFTPRVVTRNPESEASVKLKARGVEVVKADTADKISLVNAIRGSEAVFAVQDSLVYRVLNFEHGSQITHGKNIIDAAKEVGVKFFIFSSVPGLTKLTGGKFTKVFHYDDKEGIEEYLRSSGLANASLHLGSFGENLWRQRGLKKTPTGFDMSIPKYTTTALQAFSWIGHDVGESVLALLKNYTDPSKNIYGKAYPVVTGYMTYPELAAMISKALGVEVTFTIMPSCGNAIYDEMAPSCEYNGFYTSTPVPNPDLVALGAEFGTMEEFMAAEIKTRFG
ncbi:hypothetical protein K438DRAFT_1588502 [Mycena galopus ATCC 62051]|nr:hypothetical protein K438DRAFT_1588502 [Mycena galopus ATCC 62051]